MKLSEIQRRVAAVKNTGRPSPSIHIDIYGHEIEITAWDTDNEMHTAPTLAAALAIVEGTQSDEEIDDDANDTGESRAIARTLDPIVMRSERQK